MLLLNHAGLSDIGLTRQNNEDVWAALPEHGFFALADGMGGHQAGEVAANDTIALLCHLIKKQDPSISHLRKAIEFANHTVYEKSRSTETLHGMGTTLCCLYWTPNSVIYAHVGDSRIYRYRNEKIEQLTKDHSLREKGLKNVITRAIGTNRRVNPEIAAIPYDPGDLFILCSDGLSDVLPMEDIAKIVNASESLELTASRLIERAKIKGSSDNITVLLIQHDKNIFRQ